MNTKIFVSPLFLFRLKTVFVSTIALLLLVSIISPVDATTILFEENFESYDQGSNLHGQGGWEGGGWQGNNAMLVGDGNGLGTMVSNGRLDPGHNLAAYSRNLFSKDLEGYQIYTLTFDAYVYSEYPETHCMGVGFQYDDFKWGVAWTRDKNSGWGFGVKNITDYSWAYYEEHVMPENQRLNMTIILDIYNLEVYGRASDGTSVVETQHFSITEDWFLAMSGIMLLQDYRSGSGGGEMDNIILSSEPIPEPATMFLLGSGLIGLAGFRRKKK